MSDKQRTTIVLTDKDKENIRIIQDEIGDPTTIAIIRYALRETAHAIAYKAWKSTVEAMGGTVENADPD